MSHGVFVKIELGPFARSGIEALSGDDVAAGVEKALARYTARLAWNDPIPPPRYFTDRDAGRAAASETFLITVAPETKAALQLEAQRQEVTMAEILRHAVSVHLAEMDGEQGSDDSKAPAAPHSLA